MTTVTIGNLIALSTVSDSTIFASEDGGLTRKVSATALKSYMGTTTSIVASGPINAGGGLTANTIQAGVIGNTGATLTGTVSTSYQPNITGLGTLSNLAVSGNTTVGVLTVSGVLTTTSNVNLSGNLVSTNAASFSAINNTVIGNVSHSSGRFTTVIATNINAGTIGNTGAILTGTLNTAAQTNITSVGTLGTLTVTGNITAGNISATKGTFTSVAGTLLTAAQTNITSVGTLSSLAVSGAVTAGNLVTTNGLYWANGVSYSSTISSSGSTAANALTGSTLSSNVTASSLTSVGTLTGLTVSGAIVPNANLTVDLGSTGAWFNNFYGVAVSAKYADLAEKYSADAVYLPGTVVVFGGSAEITVSAESHTPAVAGVISTNPAYLMNSASSGLPVALSGRVPCQVQGPVNKGDRLVNVSPGVAGRLNPAEYQPGCVIGHALESITSSDIQTIEVVIMKF